VDALDHIRGNAAATVTLVEYGDYASRVHTDLISGIRSGVTDTPTFFINGARHDDPVGFETLLAAVQAAGAQH